MVTEEQLYSDIPPTKLRNKEEKFKPAKTSKFWLWVASMFFFNMLQNRFYAFRYEGDENYFESEKDVPTILFAPHCNWWDGIVFYNITHRIFHKEIRLMVEELNRFPLLRRGGAYSVNKKSPQSAMKALQYSVDVVGDLRNMLCIFPQGIIRPPMYRPIQFQTGMAYIAKNVVKKAGGINLIPVAVNYPFLREDKPEVLCEVGEPYVLTDKNIDRKALTHELEKNFEALCDRQFYDITQGNIEGYEYLYKQKLKWYKKLEKRLKKVDVPSGSGV